MLMQEKTARRTTKSQSAEPESKAAQEPAMAAEAAMAGAKATRRLRLVLRANALSSSASGLAALVFGGWIASQLGVERHDTTIRFIGAALLVFAAAVVFEARTEPKRLLASTLQIAIGDLAWVVGSVALIAWGTFSARGTVVVATVALMVLDFAVIQLMLRRSALAATRSEPNPGRRG